MSSVNSSQQTHTFHNLSMNITAMPCSYENVTSLDVMKCNESNNAHDVTGNGSMIIFIFLISIIAIWIVIANGLVFVCLVSSRNILKSNVNVQLLSLSLTDMLVGISMILQVLASIPNLFSNSESCAVLLYLYFVAQAATLYHTLLICVHRLRVIRRTSNASHSNKTSLKMFLAQISAIWIGCLLYCSIHFLIFVPFGKTVRRCALTHLFGDGFHDALGLLTIPMFVPPYLCTNTIYIYLLIFTKRKMRAVHAMQVKPKQSSDNIELKHKIDNNTVLVEIQSTSKHHLSIQSSPQDSEEPGRSKGHTQTKCGATNDQEPSTSTAFESQNIGNHDTGFGRNVRGNTLEKLSTSVKETKPRVTNNTLPGMKLQRHALVTFGILLLSLNLFMTPLVFLDVIELLWHGYLSLDTHITFVLMAILNSALNPVINIWRIKPFRMVLMEKARQLRFW